MSAFAIKPVKTLGLAVHPSSPFSDDAVKALRAAANARGIELLPLDDGNTPGSGDACEIVASVGGDGTLLAAARRACPQGIPVWGINIGHLGYLTTSGTDEIDAGMEKLAKGKYTVEPRTMLAAEVRGVLDGESHLIALNDIVIHRKAIAGIIALDAELNGRYLQTYEGDGLVIATPTGSTAYSMSAAGSILSPTLRAFILTPICPHSLSARSLVVDDTSEVLIRPRFEHPDDLITVIADGQTASVIHAPDGRSAESAVIIKRSDQDAGLVRFEDVVFSDVLRDKLGWAGGAALR